MLHGICNGLEKPKTGTWKGGLKSLRKEFVEIDPAAFELILKTTDTVKYFKHTKTTFDPKRLD